MQIYSVIKYKVSEVQVQELLFHLHNPMLEMMKSAMVNRVNFKTIQDISMTSFKILCAGLKSIFEKQNRGYRAVRKSSKTSNKNGQ